MAYQFPAVGHKYLVDFTADDGSGQFKVQLDFHSATSLTYTGVKSDGTLGDHPRPWTSRSSRSGTSSIW